MKNIRIHLIMAGFILLSYLPVNSFEKKDYLINSKRINENQIILSCTDKTSPKGIVIGGSVLMYCGESTVSK